MSKDSLSPEILDRDNLDEAKRIGELTFETDFEQEQFARTYENFADGTRCYQDELEGRQVCLLGYYLYRKEGQPCAAAGLYHYEDAPPGEVWIGWMGVAPDFQGQGHGHHVLEHLEGAARHEFGASSISVYTPAELPEFAGARHLYASRGYREVERFVIPGEAPHERTNEPVVQQRWEKILHG